MKRRLLRDNRGTTLVEFSLLILPLMVMVASTVEIGRLLFTWVQLEGAVMEAARTATASMETTQTERETALKAAITERMGNFKTRDNLPITIETKVYRDFGSSFPENYTDSNNNKQYDPPKPGIPGEPFVDRNKNGVWDSSTPIAGTMGGPGDVVSYTARFPAPLFFSFLQSIVGNSTTLESTAVVRNEPVERRT